MDDLLLYFILFSPLLALIVAVTLYFRFRMSPGGKRRSFFWFFCGNFGVGVVAATIVGRNYCTWSSGNLCGFDSIFFGLFTFSLTVVVYSFIWVRHGKSLQLKEKTVEHPAFHATPVTHSEYRLKCPHCGAVMADSDTICVWCGKRKD